MNKSKLLSKIILLVFSFLCFLSTSFSQTQNDTLIGIVNGNLIKININTGLSSGYIPVTSLPATNNPYRLTWAEPDNCYYLAVYANNVYQLAKITAAGVYSILGTVTVGSQTALLIEGVSFNRFDGFLYISASLNGGPNSVPADYYSESLIKVNTTTLIGNLVGTFSHSAVYTPEADVLTFDDAGYMYYLDGEPGSNSNIIYKQIADMSVSSTIFYSSGYYVISDLTIRNNFLYFSSNRQLRKVNLLTGVYNLVGQMFSTAQYNGLLLRGLTWRNECPESVFPIDTLYGCLGDNLSLNSNFNSGSAYLWSNGLTSPIINVSNSGNYWVQVNSGNCIIQDTVLVQFISQPILDAGIDDTICTGEGVVLNALCNDPTATIAWSTGVIDNVSFLPTQTLTYTVQATNNFNCTSIDSVVIVVETLDDVSFGYGSISLCQSDSPQLPANVAQPGGLFGSLPFGLMINASNGEINPSTSSANTYQVTYSFGGNCPVDSTIQIVISSLPIIDAGIDDTICAGEGVVLNALCNDPTATITWSSGVIDNVSFLPTQTLTYTVQATNNFNCISTDSVEIVVETLDDVSFGYGSISLCQSDSPQLPANVAQPGGLFSSSPSGLMINASTGEINPSTSSANTYQITYSFGGNCPVDSTIQIIISSLPIIDQLPDLEVCENTTMALENLGIDPPVVFSWTNSNTSIGLNNSGINNIPTFIAQTNGTTQIATIICEPFIGACIGNPVTFNITVNPIPHVDFEVINSNLNNSFVQFNSVIVNQQIVNYSWLFGDNIGSSSPNTSHTYPETDESITYMASLTVTNAEGCTNTISHPIEFNGNFYYYVPNSFTPDGDENNNIFRPIVSEAFNLQEFSFTIFNRWGELIFESHDAQIGWDGTFNNKIIQDGVYTWVMRLAHKNNDKKETITGSVTLIR